MKKDDSNKVEQKVMPLLTPDKAREIYSDDLLVVDIRHILDSVTESFICRLANKVYINYKTVAVELGGTCSTAYMIDKKKYKQLNQTYYEERNK